MKHNVTVFFLCLYTLTVISAFLKKSTSSYVELWARIWSHEIRPFSLHCYTAEICKTIKLRRCNQKWFKYSCFICRSSNPPPLQFAVKILRITLKKVYMCSPADSRLNWKITFAIPSECFLFFFFFPLAKGVAKGVVTHRENRCGVCVCEPAAPTVLVFF